MFDKVLIEKYKNSARHHFTKHKANIIRFNDNLTTIDWKAPDTNAYYVRYIIDGDKLIITGDLGNAIFQQYGNHLTLNKVSRWINQLGYITEKCRCSGSLDVYYYDHDFAKKDRAEDLKDFVAVNSEKNADIENQEAMDNFSELLEELDDNFFEETGYMPTPRAIDLLDALSPDLLIDYVHYWGKEYSPRYIAWMVGLEMIAAQSVTN